MKFGFNNGHEYQNPSFKIINKTNGFLIKQNLIDASLESKKRKPT